MIIHEALQWGIVQLKKAGVETPALDAEVLLAHPAILQDCRMDRSWLYAHPEEHISRTEEQRYREFIARRVRREPVAYIIGHKEFWGLDFVVNRQVLIPRPETELLVAEVLKQITRYPLPVTRYTIVDVGTGSGAIVVSLVKQCSATLQHRRATLKGRTTRMQFFATDIFREALQVARKNARQHGVEELVTFLKGNLLEPIYDYLVRTTPNPSSPRRGNESISSPASDFSPLPEGGLRGVGGRGGNNRLIIVANLPYLSTAEWRATQSEIKKWEPRGALDGGKDGLKYYREMFGQLCNLRNRLIRNQKSDEEIGNKKSDFLFSIAVLCEICPEQARAFTKMVHTIWPKNSKNKTVKNDAAASNLPHGKKATIVANLPHVGIEVLRDLSGRKRVVIVRIETAA